MEKFGITKVQSLKISSIVILGQGLLAASANSLQSSREVEADQAARSIIGICPRMTSLLYNPDEFWPSEVELPLFEPEIEPHTGILPCMGAILISNLLTHSVSSLTAAHALFAFPDNAGAAFSENLTRIDINARLVRSLRRFPKIPVAKLRKVGIYNIDNLVDWELFQSNGYVLEFPRVEDLALGFADRVHGRSTVTSSVHDILFPAIRMLKVSGLAHSMMNFPAHFPPGSVTLLTLLDEPDVFLKAGYNILSCTQNLFVRSLETESTASGIELATALQRLFRQRLRLRNVAFEGVAYTLPKVINWVWLKWFQFTTHILSVKDIVKLLVQLPRLKTLVLKCQTMPLDDMGADASFDPNGANPVHASLQRFDIETQQYLDMTEIIELVSCLPAISEVGVSRDLVAAMDSCIKALLSKSHVLVREFSQV
ncbi:hypothetical protein FBU59_000981 [Linderina macrospora]|uniref:Uncharacterized protein n=1 Tax=Linderina macrospora TaxID=4868 RepID=A0ACC1JFC4_9FUNG|nr:hypothetical protein FBU59_000981 [Linderina macrospora]